MIDYISEELALILNLRNAAIDHKNKCEHNCNVSLYQLRDAAKYISRAIGAKGLPSEQQIEAAKLIEEMPII